MGRIHNFGAGPAVLPIEVINQVQEAIPNISGSGFGLMEVSHRSAIFQAIIDETEERLRQILSIPETYTVLFLQGGASLQFFMVPLNLLKNNDEADLSLIHI